MHWMGKFFVLWRYLTIQKWLNILATEEDKGNISVLYNSLLTTELQSLELNVNNYYHHTATTTTGTTTTENKHIG